MIYEDMACESTQALSAWDSYDNEPKVEDEKIVTISNLFNSNVSKNSLSLSPLLSLLPLDRKSISIEKRAFFWTHLTMDLIEPTPLAKDNYQDYPENRPDRWENP
ncbi:hypothetical protein N9Y92_04700 [Chlamydiales bacterium]|nr:hypothetical protein [Chlamydiales bacterium]